MHEGSTPATACCSPGIDKVVYAAPGHLLLTVLVCTTGLLGLLITGDRSYDEPLQVLR
jgi:hypothetical protein